MNGLIIYGGRDIADLEDSLPDVETTDPPTDEYTKFIRKLDKHFLPKKNKDYARFQLGNLQQQQDESLAKYFARVREIAKKCEYHDGNDAIRDHLIKTMRNRRIGVKAIRQGWTLQEGSSMKPLLTKSPTSKRLKWKRRFLTHKKMLNASKKSQFPSHVVAVDVNTRKNARRSALFAPPVENEITTQTSAEVNLKKRKVIVHSKTKIAMRTLPELDAIRKDEEIIENQAIVMGEFTKCQVTMKTTGNPIRATLRVTNVIFTTYRYPKRAKAFKRPARSS